MRSASAAQAPGRRTAQRRRTIIGGVAWAALLIIVAVLTNGCAEVACVDACKVALERCESGLPHQFSGGILSERDCESRCEQDADAWCECLDCVNEEESCRISCQRDDSCRFLGGTMVDG